MPTAFPFPCEWSVGYRETRSAETRVFRAVDGTEQRRQLRERPRRWHEFVARVADDRERGYLDALLYGASEAEYAVPFWPHATAITATAASGATTLTLSTTDLDFYAGSYALLWASVFAHELVSISTVAGGSLTVSATTTAWPVGTLVVPAHVGALLLPFDMQRGGVNIDETRLVFELNPLVLPVMAGTAGTTAPVMALTTGPGRTDALRDDVEQTVVTLRSPSNGFKVTKLETSPRFGRATAFLATTAAEARDFWEFWEARLGQLNPVWLPTFSRDLTPTAAVDSTATGFDILAIDYTTRLFPTVARRTIGAITGPSTITKATISAAVDNGNGTETITLSGALGIAVDPAVDLVSFLRYARLATDDATMVWWRPGAAEMQLTFLEIPEEAS